MSKRSNSCHILAGCFAEHQVPPGQDATTELKNFAQELFSWAMLARLNIMFACMHHMCSSACVAAPALIGPEAVQSHAQCRHSSPSMYKVSPSWLPPQESDLKLRANVSAACAVFQSKQCLPFCLWRTLISIPMGDETWLQAGLYLGHQQISTWE